MDNEATLLANFKGEKMEDINEELKNKLKEVLQAGFSEEALKNIDKKIKDISYELESYLEYSLKEEMASHLAGFVWEMAKRTVDSILEGNQRQMERYLGCEHGAWTGRSDSPSYGRKEGIDKWHPIIHGDFFEQGAIKLRRDIVNAHKDLITDQRILDLEDQVKSLVAQVNVATREKAEMWERVRS